jgi:alkylation response protein AidB-like acyl-CoA dehydrogenase
LNPDELAIVKRVRAFMEAKVAPVITDYWVRDAFPFELLPAVKELGIGGLAMHGYGCAGGSLAQLGFVLMEIARIDPSFTTWGSLSCTLRLGRPRPRPIARVKLRPVGHQLVPPCAYGWHCRDCRGFRPRRQSSSQN